MPHQPSLTDNNVDLAVLDLRLVQITKLEAISLKLKELLYSAIDGLLQTAHMRKCSFRTYSARLADLVDSTRSPLLTFNVLSKLGSHHLFLPHIGRLDEALLALSLRMWKDESLWNSMIPAMKDMAHLFAPQMYGSLSKQPQSSVECGRSVQFWSEAERARTLRMLANRVSGSALPAELMEQIFEYLLDVNHLPHPKDFPKIWVPWPAKRTCPYKSDRHYWCPVHGAVNTCPADVYVSWDWKRRRFKYWHRHRSTFNLSEECEDGRCEPHHS